MPVEITIELSDSGSQVLSIEELDPILVEIGVLPDLNQSWFGSPSADKNTFVDANQAEITTFLDVLPTVALSVEGAAAVTNIQSNGGLLTDAEKFFVNKWVNRMVANSDWSLMDDLAYAGFADDSCKLTKWISGDLMTNNSATLTSNKYWDLDGSNGYIDTGVVPDLYHSTGFYLEESDEADAIPLISASSTFKLSYRTSSSRYEYVDSNAGGYSGLLENYTIRKKMLISGYRTDSTNTGIIINGITKSTKTLAESVTQVDNIYLGVSNSSGSPTGGTYCSMKVSMFYSAAASIDQLDFYQGFEDFRTSLHPEILYNLPQPTGQITSYNSNDDPLIEANIFQHFRTAQSNWNGTAPKLADFFTLQQNNSFGNTDRFTDINGLQVYGDGYKIDNYTGLGWGNITATQKGLYDHITDATASTDNGFTDWFVPSRNQYQSILSQPEVLDYTPFNIAYSNNMRMSTGVTDRSEQGYYQGSLGAMYNIAVATSYHTIFCRKHF